MLYNGNVINGKNTRSRCMTKIGTMVLEEGRPKLAVSIFGRDEASMKAHLMEVKKRETEGSFLVDLIEIRMDYFENYGDSLAVEHALQGLRELEPKRPYLFTWRNATEGGQRTLSSEAYEKLILLAASSGFVDAVDVEALAFAKAPQWIRQLQSLGIPVVASFHDPEGTPEDMESLLERLYETGAEVVKLAVMAKSAEDVKRFTKASYRFTRNFSVPLISMAMGEAGEITRKNLKETGSVVTFGAVGKTSAKGQPAVEELVPWIKFAEE